MNNILAFPQDRVKGPRICMTCEIYEFRVDLPMIAFFHPAAWFYLAIVAMRGAR
jgi:hypothetical protein